MSAFVVDVNVAMVANGNSPQADTACEWACVRSLRKVLETVICIDDGDHILSEYRANLSMSGQPGVGDEFMYSVHQNQYDATKCERVTITDDYVRGFVEFPNDPLVSGLDRNERKYVAVAVGSVLDPLILNAVDPDWRDYEDGLKTHGLRIRQLCPRCLK